jgi:hypothetical protein
MLRTAPSLPHERAFVAGLRPRPFPDETASLLPGLLAATRTGLPPASDDELTNSKISRYVTASPPALLGARKGLKGLTNRRMRARMSWCERRVGRPDPPTRFRIG